MELPESNSLLFKGAGNCLQFQTDTTEINQWQINAMLSWGFCFYNFLFKIMPYVSKKKMLNYFTMWLSFSVWVWWVEAMFWHPLVFFKVCDWQQQTSVWRKSEWPLSKANWVTQGDCGRHFSEGAMFWQLQSPQWKLLHTHIVHSHPNQHSINQWYRN